MRNQKRVARKAKSVGTIALLTTGAVLCGAIGAAGVAFTVGGGAPPTLASSAEIRAIPAEHLLFADERSVDLRLTQAPTKTLTVQGVGVVTSDSCVPGTAINSGEVPFAVDGAPALALATSMPMWRDLRPGNQGTDVEALQEALAQLGTGVQVDGILGYDAFEVIAGRLVDAGYPLETFHSIPRNRILWLPENSITPTTCEINVGQQLAESAEYATVSGGLVSASIALPSSGYAPGARAITVDTVEIHVDEKGLVSSPEDLAAITSLPGYNDAIRSSDPVPISGTWHLVDLIEAVSVPATALTNFESGSACVWDGADAYPVKILGSQLGQTIIQSASGQQLPSSFSVDKKNNELECKK